MAYDEQLADRIRALLSDEPGLREQRMFGGLAFLVDGQMAVAASGQGGLMFRADPASADPLIGEHVQPMQMRGRVMTGWLRVDPAGVRTAAALRRYVRLGVQRARALPPKTT